MLPGRGASPLTTHNAIPQDANADDDDDDELSEDDEEAIRNAANVFGCNTGSQGQDSIHKKEGGYDSQNLVCNTGSQGQDSTRHKEGRHDSQNLASSQVDAVGWTSRLKVPEVNSKEKTAGISADSTFALGEESVRRNSMTARNA